MRQPCWWFIFYNNLLLIEKDKEQYNIPLSSEIPVDVDNRYVVHDIGTMGDYVCKAVQVPDMVQETDHFVMIDLRSSYDYIPAPQFAMAGKAYEILFWDKNSKFCPVCGTSTQQALPNSKKCPSCQFEIFPTISTAILALVQKEDSILLVQAHNFSGPFHSLVAGFLETGESLEECVQREVMEETGLSVKNIRYFGSQAWPFPSGLMVGFITEYESGELKLQEEELKNGAFYKKENLPELPRKLSLARKMIDWWIEK